MRVIWLGINLELQLYFNWYHVSCNPIDGFSVSVLASYPGYEAMSVPEARAALQAEVSVLQGFTDKICLSWGRTTEVLITSVKVVIHRSNHYYKWNTLNIQCQLRYNVQTFWTIWCIVRLQCYLVQKCTQLITYLQQLRLQLSYSFCLRTEIY